MCCGSNIDCFEMLSRIIVLDNLRRYLFVNFDALIFDVSFGPRRVALLGRNGLGFD